MGVLPCGLHEGCPGPPGPSCTAPAAFQELPDPEKVAAEVQQMWALTEVVRARQAAARIGRFDVSAVLTQHRRPRARGVAVCRAPSALQGPSVPRSFRR